MVRTNPDRAFFLKASLIFYALWIVSFQLVGRYAVQLPGRDITSAWDQRIPLIAAFIWPYEICYIFPFLPLFVLKDWHRFNRALLAVIIANLLAYIVYVTFPIAYPKPVLGHSFSERILFLEYTYDFNPGANKLPSLHVAFTWIVYLACRKQRLSRLGDFLVLFVAILITFSTIFVKQHLIIDAVAGIILAGGAWGAANFLYPRLADPRREARPAFKQMMRRTAPLALLLLAIILLAADIVWKKWIPW